MNVAIIGDGSVGKAMSCLLGVDPIGPGKTKVSADLIFICVPTPSDYVKGQDLSAVYDALGRCDSNNIVIRSTILPGTCETIAKSLPDNINLMHMPEFGCEDTMNYDICNPPLVVIGTRALPNLATLDLEHNWIDCYPESVVIKGTIGGLCDDSKTYGAYIPVARLFKNKRTYIVEWKVAETIKYLSNLMNASKIAMLNTMYDWAQSLGLEDGGWKQASEITKQIPIPVGWGWNIWHKGFRGFGGKCFPKDLLAALQCSPQPLLQAIHDYNNNLTRLWEEEDPS